MKFIYSIFCILLFTVVNGQNIEQTSFQKFLDELELKGSILVFENSTGKYYSNDFRWANKGFIPASTFKIPNTIISLELGTAPDTNMIFHWDGQPKRFKFWEQDMYLSDAYRLSCVHCYQELARKNGWKNLKKYCTQFGYGNMDIKKKNEDTFWLEGKSKISSFQQIDFLKKLYFQRLDISERTYDLMKKIMQYPPYERMTIWAKTGWGDYKKEDLGWFVGYAEIEGELYFFATCVQPMNKNEENFGPKRIQATMAALETFLK